MKSFKTAWDLTLLYASEKDPNIEQDTQAIERACVLFEKQYRSDVNVFSDDAKLLEALTAYEKLLETIGGEKPLVYFWYRQELNSTDKVATAMIPLLSDRLTKAHNKVLFFELALGKLDKKRQESLLKNKTFAHFKHLLWVIFSQSEHNLGESEEKILNLKSLPSHTLWVTGFNKVLTKQTVKWKGKELTIDAARALMRTSSQKDRAKLHALTQEKLRDVADFAESELNAVVTDKKIEDELRGYKKPYSSTVLRYQNDEKVVETLVETVTKHFKIAHEFYKVKAELLGMKKITLADYSADVGKTKINIPFTQAYNLLYSTLKQTDPIYAGILETMAKKDL
jgi:oligoendopeptidase F